MNLEWYPWGMECISAVTRGMGGVGCHPGFVDQLLDGTRWAASTGSMKLTCLALALAATSTANAQQFAPESILWLSVRPYSVYATDLDGDADNLSASLDDDKVAWYENLMGGPIGTSYCGPAIPNSMGQTGVLTVTGSTAFLDNDLAVEATQLPPNSFGIFLTSMT